MMKEKKLIEGEHAIDELDKANLIEQSIIMPGRSLLTLITILPLSLMLFMKFLFWIM